MTAPGERGDAELVAGLRAGDQRCLAGIYDRYADRLYDFCAGMLRDRDEAADAVQDTFLLVNARIGQLRDPERLRPWLYAIARSVALNRARARGRVRPTDAVIDTVDPAAGPERLAEQEALRRLVADVSDGLSEGDRAMLRLHLHGLEGAELGAALGISPSTAHVRLSRLRDQVERALGALLVARLGRRDCDELTAVLGEWDGRFTPLLRKRVARHVDSCPRCGERRRAVASPWALLSGVVVLVAPAELRDRVLGAVQLVAHSSPTPDGDPDAAPAPGATLTEVPTRRRRSPMARGVAAALVVAALAGVALLWGTRSVTLSETPTVPHEPVTSGPAGPSAAPETLPGAVPGSSAGAVPDPVAGAVPNTPSADSTTAAGAPPAVGSSTGSGPSRATTSVPLPGSTVSPGPGRTAVLDPPPPSPDTTTDPAPQRPRIVGQDVSPPRLGPRGCPDDRADVRVTLAAEAPATAVVLSWTKAGESGSMAMRGSGTTWSGSLGPFREPGRVQWSVTASNAAGSTTGPAEEIAVTSCTVRGTIR